MLGLRKGVAVLTLAAAVSMIAALPAAAGNDDVIRRGACSGSSDWKLKLSPEDGRIEVEFEVDQNASGDVWRVRLKHDGDAFFRGERTTRDPSGSFTVRRLETNTAGHDVFVARARNMQTDETCAGRATFTA